MQNYLFRCLVLLILFSPSLPGEVSATVFGSTALLSYRDLLKNDALSKLR